MLAQHLEFPGQLAGAVAGEQVAGIGVAGHQPQRLLLATATDQDRWMRLTQRRRRAQWLGQRVVLAVDRLRVATPHVRGDLERFLEHFETFSDARKRQPESARLALVPAGADTEPGSTT